MSDHPEPGYWLGRYRLGARSWGPLVPAAIVRFHTTAEPGQPDNKMERSPFLAAFIAGEAVGLYDLHQVTHTYPKHIFRCEAEISEAEYKFRVADLRWSQEHAPDEPQANPRKSIDPLTATLPF